MRPHTRLGLLRPIRVADNTCMQLWLSHIVRANDSPSPQIEFSTASVVSQVGYVNCPFVDWAGVPSVRSCLLSDSHAV